MEKSHNLNTVGAIGLVLMWYRTRGTCSRSLAMLFGQTSTIMYNWLKFLSFFLNVLSRDSDSKVSLPTVDDVIFYQSTIGEKFPLCHKVCGVIKGLNILIQSSKD